MQNKTITESLIASNGWMPKAASTFAPNIDGLFNFILYGSILLFVGILIVTALFIIKYRKRPGYSPPSGPHITHNTFLELAWTVPPLILTIFIFYWGFTGFLDMAVAPKNSLDISVTGKKWMWQFEYKNGTKTLGEIVVPVNTPVSLIMSSEDVIHSFYVPNFRIKRDVIPNRYTKQWFEATRTGTFQIFCTEYCGDGHSQMLGVIRVVSADDYEKWLANAGSADDGLPPEKLGEKLYTSKGCVACHSVDGTNKIGPTWKGLFGKTRAYAGGSTVADENYIKESIENPTAKVVTGYQPVMPSFKGLLNDKEIAGVIAYIKTLK